MLPEDIMTQFSTFCCLFCLKMFQNIDFYINNSDIVATGIRKHIPAAFIKMMHFGVYFVLTKFFLMFKLYYIDIMIL